MMDFALENHLRSLYAENPFVNLLQMKIVEMSEASITLNMPIVNKHANLYKATHGGAIASLADTAMGLACATTGKKVVTLDMSLNYIRNVPIGDSLTAVAKLIHNGSRTMVSETNIYNSENKIVVAARATFFVTGTFL
jgi:acyl-CoA thioesterase